jgi:hypothetical protein
MGICDVTADTIVLYPKNSIALAKQQVYYFNENMDATLRH